MPSILFAILPALLGLGPREACPRVDAASGTAVVGAESTLVFPSAPVAAVRTVSVVSSRETSVLDDEVEIPDESEDDQPDDAGRAIHHKGRSCHVLPLQGDASVACFVPAPRPARFECISSETERPRFLGLCRLLI